MNAHVPLLWINLERADRRRRRMTWALETGGWQHERIDAIDAMDRQCRFKARPDLRLRGSRFPGVHRLDEARSFRRTSRSELACLASWQLAIARAAEVMREHDTQHVLLLEDDVGASIAEPDAWPTSLQDIIDDIDARNDSATDPWTIIQLAPISPHARRSLYDQWIESGRSLCSVPKTSIRSHGNGAVLLHRRALPFLRPHIRDTTHESQMYVLRHPWAVRPVADKWLYACLPAATVHVATFPLFCLDAADSDIHPDHVSSFHRASREITLDLWRQEGLQKLVDAQNTWDHLD